MAVFEAGRLLRSHTARTGYLLRAAAAAAVDESNPGTGSALCRSVKDLVGGTNLLVVVILLLALLR